MLRLRAAFASCVLLATVLGVLSSPAAARAADFHDGVEEMRNAFCNNKDKDCALLRVSAESSTSGFRASFMRNMLDFSKNTVTALLDTPTDIFPRPSPAVAAYETFTNEGASLGYRRLVERVPLGQQGLALGVPVDVFSEREWAKVANKQVTDDHDGL